MNFSRAAEELPPQSLDSEQATIGSLILGTGEPLRQRLEFARSCLRPEHFYRESNGKIFAAVLSVHDAGAVPDILTVANELERRGQLHDCGGRAYLMACIDIVPAAERLPQYVALVQKAAGLRQLIEVGAEIVGLGYSHPDVLEEALTRALSKVNQLSDFWRRAGYGNGLKTFTAAELSRRDVGEAIEVVEGLLYDGLTILVGGTKLGKSWLVYQIAIAVALGVRVLSEIVCRQRTVLYLALEDDDRRLKKRLLSLLDGAPPPEHLHLATESPTIQQGLLAKIIAFHDDHPDLGLVIVDTLARVRGKPDARAQVYYEDSEFVQQLQALALERKIAILLVHHTNKAAHDDWANSMSGSTGLQGPADGMLKLSRVRGESRARIERTGRNFEAETPLVVEWADRVGWVLKGEAEVIERSEAEIAVLQALEERGCAATPTVLAQTLKKDPRTLGKHLQRMEERKLLSNLQGWYSPTPLGREALRGTQRGDREAGGDKMAESASPASYDFRAMPASAASQNGMGGSGGTGGTGGTGGSWGHAIASPDAYADPEEGHPIEAGFDGDPQEGS